MAKRKVSDKMMDFSAQVGVHPYDVTPEHVLAATAAGDLSAEDCEDFLKELDAAFGDPEAAIN